MTAVAVRQAHAADVPVLKALVNEMEAWLSRFDAEPAPVHAARADPLEALAFGPDRLCEILVAEHDDEIAGYLIYYFGIWIGSDIARCLYVADIFVRELHQRRGIGRAMMEHARQIARQRGARNLFWTVWRENPVGQAFYRKLGAEAFDEEIMMRWRIAPE